MKRLILKSLVLVMMLTSAASASSYNFTVDGFYYDIVSISDLTCAVTNNDNVYDKEYSGDIVIPERVTYNGHTLTVTEIGDSAFYGCSGLTSVSIPNSVTEIGNYVFSNCRDLEKLVIEDGTETLSIECNSVTAAGESNLFYNCPLETLYLGRNLKYPEDSEDYRFGISPFRGIKSLAEVTVGSSVTSLGNNLFMSCTGLKKLVMEDGTEVLSLGYNNAYYYREGLF